MDLRNIRVVSVDSIESIEPLEMGRESSHGRVDLNMTVGPEQRARFAG